MSEIQADDDVQKVEEELLDAVQKLDQLNVTIRKSNNEIKIWKGLVKKLLQKIAEKKGVVAEMTKQVEVSKKCILKLQSKKNRLLRPVQLCSALYGEIFNVGLQFEHVEHLEQLVPLFLIGKEAKNGLVQVLQFYKKLTFTDHEICLKNSSKVIFGDYSKFSTMLVQSIAPYVTKVCFDGKVTANYQQLFFESLSKNQRNVTIKNLRKVDEILIETVKKLNEKNIFVTLKNPEDDILFKLSGLRFDCLKLSITKDEFSFFIWNNFPCTFSKLNIQFVDSRVLKNLEKVFRKLNEAYSSVQKLEISFPIDYIPDTESEWNERKQWIEDAPQQEIIANFHYQTKSKQEREKAIASFGGIRIDGNLSQWESSKNKMKVINFHHKLRKSSSNPLPRWSSVLSFDLDPPRRHISFSSFGFNNSVFDLDD